MMPDHRLLLSVATVAALTAGSAAVGSAQDATQLAAQRDRDRCDAVLAAIDSLVSSEQGPIIALRDSTALSSTEPMSGLLSTTAVDSAMILDFVDANSVRRPVCHTAPSDRRIQLVTDLAWTALSRGPAGRQSIDVVWRTFYDAFPGVNGLSVVSGIALSEDRRQAMFVLTHACGTQCGRVWAVLVERREDGPWRVAHSRLVMEI